MSALPEIELERSPHYELGVQDATIAELRRQLTTACRQWKMYAEMQENRDLASEPSTEGGLYRRAIECSKAKGEATP